MSLENKLNLSDWTLNSTKLLLLAKFNLTTTEPPEMDTLYPLSLVVPFTFVYALIFVTGVVGNVSTCIVIARNRSMHTATNYYLFSLAISDMLLLVSGLPPEMYRIWSPDVYIFGEPFCVLQGFAAETSANATVLTITAFTIERYLAICHPFLSYTMSKLSRAIRFIIAIWIIALCLAIPQAIQFGIEYEVRFDGQKNSHCTVVSNIFEHAFEISTFVFFVGPMTLITVLYVLIGCQLRQSERSLGAQQRTSVSNTTTSESRRRMLRHQAAQNKVVRMLIAVVTAFFVCWAPFHAQRLLAVYLSNASPEAQQTFIKIYTILMYTSGVLYFLSTTINPLLYSIMSNKFRKAFKKTFHVCGPKRRHTNNHRPSYHNLTKAQHPLRTPQHCGANNQQIRITTTELQKLSKNVETINLQEKPTNDFLEDRQNVTNQRRRTRCNSKISQNSSSSIMTSRLNSFDSTNCREKRKYFHFLNVFNFFRTQTKHQPVNGGGEKQSTSITISNSSLQDLDDTEFSSFELVQYMQEVNEKL